MPATRTEKLRKLQEDNESLRFELKKMQEQMKNLQKSAEKREEKETEECEEDEDEDEDERDRHHPRRGFTIRSATIAKLATFNGYKNDNPRGWIEKLEIVLEDLPNVEACKQFRLKLDGSAEDWYRNIDRDVAGDFSLLCVAFREKYVHNQNEKWIVDTEIANKRQLKEETIEVYEAALQKLWSRTDKSSREKLTDFVRGLQSAIKVEVIKADAKTLEEAVREAKKAESLAKIAQEGTTDSIQVISDNSMSSSIAALQREIKDMRREMMSAPHALSAPAPTPGPDRTTTGKPLCSYCHRAGHVIQSCRRKQGACYLCGEREHLMKDCPQNTKPQRSGNE